MNDNFDFVIKVNIVLLVTHLPILDVTISNGSVYVSRKFVTTVIK